MLALPGAAWLRFLSFSPSHLRLRKYPSFRYSTVASTNHERIKIPVRNDGHIDLDIHHPTAPPATTSPARLIINLPPGPSAPMSPASLPVFLPPNFPTITINYRLSPTNSFPTPVHDVLAGYDWILTNLLPPSTSPPSTTHPEEARIAVTGQHIGGTLALMLALTESCLDASSPQKARVVAAAVKDPICDWVSPPFSSSSSSATAAETKTFQRLRDRCFPSDKPARYFDPFASPVHFLRSPAAPVPAPRRGGLADDFAALVGLEEDVGRRDVGESERGVEPGKARTGFKRPLRFPPAGVDAVIPDLRVGVAERGALRGQGEEMARLVRRAVVKGEERVRGVGDRVLEEEGGINDGDVDGVMVMAEMVKVREEAERRVKLDVVREGREASGYAADVGRWLREVLFRS